MSANETACLVRYESRWWSNEAAGGAEVLSGQPARVGADQEGHHVGDVRRLAEPAQRGHRGRPLRGIRRQGPGKVAVCTKCPNMPVAGIWLPPGSTQSRGTRPQPGVIGQMVTNRDFAGALPVLVAEPDRHHGAGLKSLSSTLTNPLVRMPLPGVDERGAVRGMCQSVIPIGLPRWPCRTTLMAYQLIDSSGLGCHRPPATSRSCATGRAASKGSSRPSRTLCDLGVPS
jgi:hypothetical protein